jgi:3-deoxy-manno-octulosonate cytidylyltransferase (CMP-KDO synthetase)
MKTVAIIPARMGSGRFPGKPLSDIDGLSMIAHCYLRTKLSKSITRTVVATPNQEVVDEIQKIGGDVILTPEFDMCNDRIAWAYDAIAKKDGAYDLVINVQGDQPLVYPQMLDELVSARRVDPHFTSYTMVEPCSTLEDFYDLNRVKVLFREKDGGLIYMSRAPIPSPKKKNILPEKTYKHVAIIGFEPAFLKKFLEFGMTYNEEIEGIDYNRVIEMGEQMKVISTPIVTDTIDTPEDLARVRIIMKKDPLWLSGDYTPQAQKIA